MKALRKLLRSLHAPRPVELLPGHVYALQASRNVSAEEWYAIRKHLESVAPGVRFAIFGPDLRIVTDAEPRR